MDYIIGAIIALIGGIIISLINRGIVERTTNKSLEEYSKLLIKDLEKTGQEIKAKIGIEVLSKNRQEWINDLRNNIANFKSISDELRKSIVYPSYNKRYRTDKPPLHVQKLEDIYNYLLLLLNPKELKSKRILSRTKGIINYFHNLEFDIPLSEIDDQYRQKEDNEFYCLQQRLMMCTQRVLKEEWERVKKGK